jgi:hypothetical protein
MHPRRYSYQCRNWSISPCSGNFYVRNAIDRYAIAPWMLLKYNPDGSLDIYLQANSPGADKDSNWLPIPPNGPINVTIRVYWPKEALLNGPTISRRSGR